MVVHCRGMGEQMPGGVQKKEPEVTAWQERACEMNGSRVTF